jgi:hypothetical protein
MSRTRRTGKEIIVHERTVQERGVQASALVWPTLTTTNYVECALMMQINMEAASCGMRWKGIDTSQTYL